MLVFRSPRNLTLTYPTRQRLNPKPSPTPKPSIQRSLMTQRPLIKPNSSFLRRATRNLPHSGARPHHSDSLRPGLDLAYHHHPSERARPLASHPLPQHSGSLQGHPLLVNPLPLRCLDNRLFRMLPSRHSAHQTQLLGGPPLVNQMLPNLHLEHRHSGNRHSVSLASVNRPRQPQLQALEGADSRLLRPSRQPLVSLHLVSPGSVVALLRQCLVSLVLKPRQQVAERGREPAEADSAPLHRPLLPASHKQLPTLQHQPAPLGRVRAPLLSLVAIHLEHPLSPPPMRLDSLFNRRAERSGLTPLHSVHRSHSPVLPQRLEVVLPRSDPQRRE